jgi:hypothetical protein
VRVYERILRPARERHVLLQRHLQAVRPHAPHRRAAHPRELLEPRTQIVRRDGEEVAGDATRGSSLDLPPGSHLQRMR